MAVVDGEEKSGGADRPYGDEVVLAYLRQKEGEHGVEHDTGMEMVAKMEAGAHQRHPKMGEMKPNSAHEERNSKLREGKDRLGGGTCGNTVGFKRGSLRRRGARRKHFRVVECDRARGRSWCRQGSVWELCPVGAHDEGRRRGVGGKKTWPEEWQRRRSSLA